MLEFIVKQQKRYHSRELPSRMPENNKMPDKTVNPLHFQYQKHEKTISPTEEKPHSKRSRRKNL